MKKYIELNHRNFEVKKVKGEVHSLGLRTLDDCYAKPSSFKREIYNDWDNWLLELANSGHSDYGYGLITVLSFNCMVFTLGAEVYNKVGKLIGYLYITKTRQEIWLA